MINKVPLVSIGLPVYNGEKYLKESLEVLINQSYQNIELIISDDASADSAPLICRRYAEKDKRIKYFYQNMNIGPIDNFNFVLTKSSGKYFLWAASDDLRDKDYIKKLVTVLETHPEYDMVTTDYIYFSKRSRSVRKFFTPRFSNNKRIRSILTFLYNGPHISDVLNYGIFRTAKLKLLGGKIKDAKRRYLKNLNSDVYALFYLLMNGIQFYIYPEILFFKRDSSVNLDLYNEIEEGDLPKNIFKKSFRYFFLFPIVFIYDFFSFLNLIIKSKYNLKEKTVIFFYLCWNTLFVRFLRHYYGVIKGLPYFVKGVWKKLIS